MIIIAGNVSYIPVAAIPESYISIFLNIPLPVAIVSNTPYVPT